MIVEGDNITGLINILGCNQLYIYIWLLFNEIRFIENKKEYIIYIDYSYVIMMRLLILKRRLRNVLN